MNTLEEITKSCPFPIGHENIEYEQYFAGKSYLYPLSSEQVSIANVTLNLIVVITGIFIMVAVKFFFVPQETDIIKNGEKILWNFMQAMS